jgi:mono/diheme cytochrome c family protein
VPPIFEVTVLSASILTTIAMLAIYFKLPNTAHPLHDTPYMKAVSADKFGIAIQTTDPLFDERKAARFLTSLGGHPVAPVHYDAEDAAHRPALFDRKFVAVLAVVALVTSALTFGTLNQVLYWQPFNWMQNQHKLKAQKPDAFFANGIGMRTPVDGTVARGFIPYAFKGNPELAGKELVNPLLPTKEILAKGKQKYLTFCSPCHGNFAGGDSRLNGQFPSPPTLHSDKVRNWPDGRIYHIITEGQNAMPSYAAQIAREDRWAIVHYLRVLQRARNPKESDLR